MFATKKERGLVPLLNVYILLPLAHTLIAIIMQSVVSGQAPITLEGNIASESRKHDIRNRELNQTFVC